MAERPTTPTGMLADEGTTLAEVGIYESVEERLRYLEQQSDMYKSLNVENARLKDRVNELECQKQEHDQLKERVNDLGHRNEANAPLNGRVDDLERKTNENDELKQRIANLESQNAHLTGSVKSINDQIEIKQREVRWLSTQLDRDDRKIQVLESSLNDNDKSLRTMEKFISSIFQIIDERNKANADNGKAKKTPKKTKKSEKTKGDGPSVIGLPTDVVQTVHIDTETLASTRVDDLFALFGSVLPIYRETSADARLTQSDPVASAPSTPRSDQRRPVTVPMAPTSHPSNPAVHEGDDDDSRLYSTRI